MVWLCMERGVGDGMPLGWKLTVGDGRRSNLNRNMSAWDSTWVTRNLRYGGSRACEGCGYWRITADCFSQKPTDSMGYWNDFFQPCLGI